MAGDGRSQAPATRSGRLGALDAILYYAVRAPPWDPGSTSSRARHGRARSRALFLPRRLRLDGCIGRGRRSCDGSRRLVLSLWAEAAARNEIGGGTRGGTLPFTLAHDVASPEEVDSVLSTARAASATVHDAENRDWGGYSGYFTDPDGFRWQVGLESASNRRVSAGREYSALCRDGVGSAIGKNPGDEAQSR